MLSYFTGSPGTMAVQPVLVVTCGNRDRADDGMGAQIATALAARKLPGVEVFDVGLNPARLILESREQRAALIVVDAVEMSGCAPGRVVEVDLLADDRPELVSEGRASSHGFGLLDQVELLRTLDALPPIARLVGVTVADTTLGASMSAAMRAALPKVVDTIAALALRRHA